jgi:glucosyl-dolichyl phosphate glucuronosyltransferase
MARSSVSDYLPIEIWPPFSRARNRAVYAARGDYLVWTDDDVVVDPNWLAAYVAAFRRRPEAAVFGGPVFPRYEPPVPQ